MNLRTRSVELFKLVDLPKAIELKRFSVNGDSPEQKNTIH